MSDRLSLFFCGDVMTGRGIDQVMPYPSAPRIHESYIDSAVDYVELAEMANGAIPRPVDYAYIWGDALTELAQRVPDARVINLETSITTSEDFLFKGINYRMHPKNTACLRAAHIDCCSLANNHVLDWGTAGLVETLKVLHDAQIKTAGAGTDFAEARAPAIIDVAGTGRAIVFAFGMDTSGVPSGWAATSDRAGVNFLADLSQRTQTRVADTIAEFHQPRDVTIVSIHWGANWGYDIAREQIEFAHQLIDGANVNIVYGHSSHHVKAIEIYNNRPIFYGCGDFINDYEGISGYEYYRGELSLMYFPVIDVATGSLAELTLVPMRMRNFRLQRATHDEAQWLAHTLNREGQRFRNHVVPLADGRFALRW